MRHTSRQLAFLRPCSPRRSQSAEREAAGAQSTERPLHPSLMFYTFISSTVSTSMLGKSWDSGSPAITKLSKLFLHSANFHTQSRHQAVLAGGHSVASNKKDLLHSGDAISSTLPDAPFTRSWKADIFKPYKLFLNWIFHPLTPR